MAVNEADVDRPRQIVLWVECFARPPRHAPMPRQGETDHRAGEIVTREKITGRKVVGLKPCVNPVAVGDNRRAGWPGDIGFVPVILRLVLGSAEARVVISVKPPVEDIAALVVEALRSSPKPRLIQRTTAGMPALGLGGSGRSRRADARGVDSAVIGRQGRNPKGVVHRWRGLSVVWHRLAEVRQVHEGRKRQGLRVV